MTTSFSVQPHFHIWQRYNKPNPNPNIVPSLHCTNYFFILTYTIMLVAVSTELTITFPAVLKSAPNSQRLPNGS